MYRKNDLPRFILPVRLEPDEGEQIQSALKNIAANALVCHGCGCCGCMEPHGTYRRGITYLRDGKVVDSFVMIPVFYCTCCNYYHAILTDFLIPFCSFTLHFVLSVLKDYLERPCGITIHEICSKYRISSRTLYAWKKRFLAHYASLAASMDIPSTTQEPCESFSDADLDACEEPGASPESSQIPNQTVQTCLNTHATLHAPIEKLLCLPCLAPTFFALFGFSFLQGNHKKHLKALPRPGQA